jgi:Tfp pilus assembly protein PilX
MDTQLMENLTMKNVTGYRERGVALFFAIFALLLLTAITAALVFMANTETSINSNYRQEQIAYFAAKAGIEEARARMMQSDPSTINPSATPLPIAAPTTINSGAIYIVNPGSTANSVQPWNSSNTYADDELCHDGYSGYTGALFASANVVAPDVRCDPTQLPSGTGWYTSYNSSLPYFGTSSALPYKWVRIAPKLNSSVSYLTGAGSTATISTYLVNSGVSTSASTVICWDGAEELPLTAPATICSQMLNAAGAPMTDVYLITALGVSPTGARKMVQAEVALTPNPPFPYGLYATSNVCPALTFSGSNASTDSYTTAGVGTYATTKTNTGGDVGSNGEVSVQNGQIGGIVGVLQAPPAGPGTCATPVTVGPNGTMLGTIACPSGNSIACYLPQPVSFPTPPAPNPLPPTTAYVPPSCGKKKTGQCIVPGSYGNISITGTLTMAPGTYNINSLSMTGNAQIIVNPPGAVTLNFAGVGVTTAVAIGGNGITDDNFPNDFVINYAGTDAVTIAGNGNVTAILNTPNAPIAQQGNGNWYGAILGSTITIGGNGFFHFDRNAALAPTNNGYYTMISFRAVPY